MLESRSECTGMPSSSSQRAVSSTSLLERKSRAIELHSYPRSFRERKRAMILTLTSSSVSSFNAAHSTCSTRTTPPPSVLAEDWREE